MTRPTTPADPDEAAFLAAIRDRPDDDTPRLVYADWLEENGRPDRAEFIRVQCELAKPSPGCNCDSGPHQPGCPFGEWIDRQAELRRREKDLLTGPRPAIYSPGVVWFNQGDGTDTWHFLFAPEFRRGFPNAVACLASHWLELGDSVLGRYPVREVTLAAWPEIVIGETRWSQGIDRRVMVGVRVRAEWEVTFQPGDHMRRYGAEVTVTMRDKNEGVAEQKIEAFRRRVADARTVPGAMSLRWPGVAFRLPGERSD